MDQDEDNRATQRIMDGTSWNEFCDMLKKAGSIVLGDDTPADPFDRAEGFRYLSRLTRGALETFLEGADPLAPELRCNAHETIKMGADNPDNLYQSASISGKHEYRVSGSRGTVHYLGFGTQAGNYGATGSFETTGYVEAADLEIGSEGRFELIVSTDKRPGNWLPMREDSRTLLVRQTFLDKKNETAADLKVERIDGPHAARPVSAASVDGGLTASGRFVIGCASLFNKWANGMKPHTNRLPEFDRAVATAAGGDPNVVYYHGYWELAADEALVIKVTPPECDYWNFQLNNHWMESLDYRYFPVSVNKHGAKYRPDGSVQIVVAHENPGMDNWMDTCGHARGTMCWRWIRATEHPEPATRVVKKSELRG